MPTAFGGFLGVSWFAGCGFDFGFPHYFGPVDNRLDTNHATVNQKKGSEEEEGMTT